MTPADVFPPDVAAHVSVTDGGCWHWSGSRDSDGYAMHTFEDGRVRMSRWVVGRTGSIPLGSEVDHRCHTLDVRCTGGYCLHRRCVNPGHLEIVSHAENGRRRIMRVRVRMAHEARRMA